MRRFASFAVLAALLVGAGAVQAQVTIKLKERGVGESGVVTRNETATTKVTVTDAGGQTIVDQKEVKGENAEYTETILAREAGKQPTKLERAYTKSQVTKEKETDDTPLQGKTVIITKKGDKYEFTYKGGEAVDGQAAAMLTKDFGKKSDTNAELEKLVLPKGAVKAGESWKIDMPKIITELSKQGAMEMDAAKSTGQGTLVKAYKKDGRQFGEMKFKLEMPLKTVGMGKEQLTFNPGAKIVMDMTLDACIDGASENGILKMKMVMSGTATNPNAPGVTVNLYVTADAVQTQADAKKK